MPPPKEPRIPIEVSLSGKEASAVQITMTSFGFSEGIMFGINRKRGLFVYPTFDVPFNLHGNVLNNLGTVIQTSASTLLMEGFKLGKIPISVSAETVHMYGSDDTRDFKGDSFGEKMAFVFATGSLTSNEAGTYITRLQDLHHQIFVRVVLFPLTQPALPIWLSGGSSIGEHRLGVKFKTLDAFGLYWQGEHLHF